MHSGLVTITRVILRLLSMTMTTPHMSHSAQASVPSIVLVSMSAMILIAGIPHTISPLILTENFIAHTLLQKLFLATKLLTAIVAHMESC